jgi:hypothetical protein
VNFSFYRVFPKKNATSFLRKSSSLFFLQEFRPLTPLKETYRFTSLMVIGMMKIMCNYPSKKLGSITQTIVLLKVATRLSSRVDINENQPN